MVFPFLWESLNLIVFVSAGLCFETENRGIKYIKIGVEFVFWLNSLRVAYLKAFLQV